MSLFHAPPNLNLDKLVLLFRSRFCRLVTWVLQHLMYLQVPGDLLPDEGAVRLDADARAGDRRHRLGRRRRPQRRPRLLRLRGRGAYRKYRVTCYLIPEVQGHVLCHTGSSGSRAVSYRKYRVTCSFPGSSGSRDVSHQSFRVTLLCEVPLGQSTM